MKVKHSRLHSWKTQFNLWAKFYILCQSLQLLQSPIRFYLHDNGVEMNHSCVTSLTGLVKNPFGNKKHSSQSSHPFCTLIKGVSWGQRNTWISVYSLGRAVVHRIFALYAGILWLIPLSVTFLFQTRVSLRFPFRHLEKLQQRYHYQQLKCNWILYNLRAIYWILLFLFWNFHTTFTNILSASLFNTIQKQVSVQFLLVTHPLVKWSLLEVSR